MSLPFSFKSSQRDDEPLCKKILTSSIYNFPGCGGNLEPSEGFNSSSSIACSLRSNSMECNVTCREGHASVFPEFLKLQCEQNKWIRRNNEGKYVPISDLKNPPRCYRK